MNKKLIWGIVIVIIVVAGIAYYDSMFKPICWPYCENMTDQDREKIKESALDSRKLSARYISTSTQSENSPSTSDWKTYNFAGSPYIVSGPISFKYPSNWVLDTTYYTTPGGSKNITSLTITSPSGIEQIAFSNGGNQGNLTCQEVEKQNTQESRGKIVCNMINNTPFYLTYTTNSEVVEIYNRIIDSVKITN